jgi:hypothetical protein
MPITKKISRFVAEVKCDACSGGKDWEGKSLEDLEKLLVEQGWHKNGNIWVCKDCHDEFMEVGKLIGFFDANGNLIE